MFVISKITAELPFLVLTFFTFFLRKRSKTYLLRPPPLPLPTAPLPSPAYSLYSSLPYEWVWIRYCIWPITINANREVNQSRIDKEINFPRRGEGGIPRNSWWGCAARFSKSWPYFRPKHARIFHTGFQTWPPKSIPIFRPDTYVYKGLNYLTNHHRLG